MVKDSISTTGDDFFDTSMDSLTDPWWGTTTEDPCCQSIMGNPCILSSQESFVTVYCHTTYLWNYYDDEDELLLSKESKQSLGGPPNAVRFTQTPVYKNVSTMFRRCIADGDGHCNICEESFGDCLSYSSGK